jgi:hypothetical protein
LVVEIGDFKKSAQHIYSAEEKLRVIDVNILKNKKCFMLGICKYVFATNSQ